MAHALGVRIGIDVGGTFTDLFLFDEASGGTVRHKLPSTPADPSRAPIRGIREILDKAGAAPDRVRFVGLGTTVATNALLERKGAPTALITTRGFRDLLEIGRQKRPHLYDLFVRKPAPLVPRALRLEVTERMGPDGDVVVALDEGSVHEALDRVKQAKVASVAICLLNSYADPRHEAQVAQLVHRYCPHVAVATSHELVPEFREYERLSSTVVNAYLMPVMQTYLARFREDVRALGISQPPLVMTSGGGVVSTELAGARPIDLLLSGPSGGVSGALYLASAAGHANLITFDMGGTSTDVCLIQDARAEVAHGRTIDGLPIRSTSLDIHTVGAGGSSIAWIDAGGLLRVGPHSAGAVPGPACYGVVGAKPTVTDANVVLGRLNREYLLDGALRIDAARSVTAIEETVAAPRELDVREAAAAIIAVSNTSIAQAIRFVSVERGLDPAAFTLVAFGGAGPLHAAAVARELDMTVLVPPAPGVLCAMGVLTKPIQLDLSQTRLVRGQNDATAQAVDAIYGELERRAVDSFGRSGAPASACSMARMADVRYQGQNFELAVDVPAGKISVEALGIARERFDAAHKRLYGYDKPDKEIEIVTFRLQARLPVANPDIAARTDAAAGSAAAPRARRETYFESVDAFVRCPVFARDDLRVGHVVQGPAIVEQMDTTTVIPPDFTGETDAWGNLILRRRAETPS